MPKKWEKAVVDEYKAKFPAKKFIPGQSTVPVSGKVFNQEEMLLATEAVLEGWWTEGRFADLFESKIRNWLGIKYAVLVNSGSSANLLAVTALTSNQIPARKRLKKG